MIPDDVSRCDGHLVDLSMGTADPICPRREYCARYVQIDLDRTMLADKLLPMSTGLCQDGADHFIPAELRGLILPWPARNLHPNARVHWSVRARSAKAARSEAHLLTRHAGWHVHWLPPGRLHLWLTFYPPDKRRRDDDGLLASVKAARDGIADALGIDDSRFMSHPYLSDQVRKGGEVHVRITGGSGHAE